MKRAVAAGLGMLLMGVGPAAFADENPCDPANPQIRYFPYVVTREDGTPKIEGGYCGSQKHGAWSLWGYKGALYQTGTYANGVKHGHWRYYSEQGGFLSSEGDYVNGKKEGTWYKYFGNREILEEAHYHEGRLIGSFDFNDRYSQIHAEFPDGEFRQDYKGNISISQLKDGRPDGDWTIQRYNGVLKAGFRNGIRTGHWSFTTNEGCVLNEGDYVKGRRDGNWMFQQLSWLREQEVPQGQKRTQTCIPAAVGRYKKGVRVGYWRVTDADNCTSEGIFKNDQPDGLWTYRASRSPQDPPCVVTKTGVYREGVQNGRWRNVAYWNADEGEYRDGLKSGLWVTTDQSARFPGCHISSVSSYENDKLSGPKFSYSMKTCPCPDGYALADPLAVGDAAKSLVDPQTVCSPESVSTYKDGRLQRVELFDRSQQIVAVNNYVDGKPVGPEYRFVDDQRHIEACENVAAPSFDAPRLQTEGSGPDDRAEGLKNSFRHCQIYTVSKPVVVVRDAWYASTPDYSGLFGDYRERYDDGSVKIEGHFPDGHIVGYHQNGQKQGEGDYQDGNREGPWTRWHDNGQVSQTGSYKQGKMDGHWTFFHSNGRRSTEGDLQNGFMLHVWRHWRDDGTLLGALTFENGVVTESSCWNRDGTPTECRILQNFDSTGYLYFPVDSEKEPADPTGASNGCRIAPR